jgi:hypothetical protein
VTFASTIMLFLPSPKTISLSFQNPQRCLLKFYMTPLNYPIWLLSFVVTLLKWIIVLPTKPSNYFSEPKRITKSIHYHNTTSEILEQDSSQENRKCNIRNSFHSCWKSSPVDGEAS